MLWIACAAALIFFSLWRRSKAEGVQTAKQIAFSHAEAWLSDKAIQPETVRYDAYFGRPYSLAEDAAVIVGTGSFASGEDIGFVAEVHPRYGILSGKLIRPAGVATWHKQASLRCLSSSLPLATVLGKMAEELEIQTIEREIEKKQRAMDDIQRIVASTERAKAVAHEDVIRQVKAMTETVDESPPAAAPTGRRRPAFDESPAKERIAELRSRIDKESRRRTRRDL